MGTTANRNGIAAARFRRLRHFGRWEEPSGELPPLAEWRARLAVRVERDRSAFALERALRAEIPAVLAVAASVRKRVRWGPPAFFGDPHPGDRVGVSTSQFFGSDARAITWERLAVTEWE